MFKQRYSKWIPFGNYTFDRTNYIVFARKNLRSGMMSFKTKRVHDRWFFHNSFVPILIDVKEAWQVLTNL